MASIRNVSVRKREENRIYLAGDADEFAPGRNYCFYYQYEKGALEPIGKKAFVKLAGAPKGAYRKFDFEKEDMWIPDEGDGTYDLVVYTVGKSYTDRLTLESKHPFAVSRFFCPTGGAGHDKRIGEILEHLKTLRATIRKTPTRVHDSVINELSETVKDILSTVRGGAEVEVIEAPLIISYPKSGKRTLTTGTTTINIKGRQVVQADGTVDDLYSPRAFKMCRSLLIYTDREVDVRVLNGGDMVLMSSFFTGSQQLLNLGEFDSIEIDATGDTQFYIAMSEDPDGAPSTVQVTELDATPKPTGENRTTDSAATAVGSFTEIVSYTPADGVTFSLSKIIVTWAGSDEQAVRVKLDTEMVAMYHGSDYIMDWFPSGMSLLGDGTKKVSIEAEAITVLATLTGFIAGEET